MTPSLNARKKESYKIFDEIAGSYDFLNRFLSIGIDTYWRRKLLKKLPEKPTIKALDLACGTGDVPLVLIKNPKVTKVEGLDLSKEMIQIGDRKIKKKNLSHKIKLKHGDATSLNYPDQSLDLVTISFGIRNFDDPEKSLSEIYRVLTPGGKVLITELTVPENRLIKFIYTLYFRFILPNIGNLLSGHKDAYTYLNKTVEDFPSGKQFEKKLISSQFKKTAYTPLTFGIATLYEGEKVL